MEAELHGAGDGGVVEVGVVGAPQLAQLVGDAVTTG